MSGECRVYPKNTNCGETAQPGAGVRDCPPFDICLLFGARLSFDGDCLTFTPGTPPADGVYGKVLVQGGCLVGVDEETIPRYTPAPCTPAPAPCTGDTSGALALSPDQRNILAWDASGRLLGAVFMEPGDNIAITGTGKQGDPFVVSGRIEPNDTFVVSFTKDILTVTGAGTQADPYQIGHVEAAEFAPGTYAGFTIDKYGHVKRYTEPSTLGYVTDVRGIPGITEVTQQGSVVLVDLPVYFTAAQTVYTLDKKLTIDSQGRVTSIEANTAVVATTHTRVFTGSRTDNTFNVDISSAGRLRIRYTGATGLSSATLAALPAGYSVQVDGESVEAYGSASGIEAVTANAYEPETHEIVITTAAAVTTPAIMDVTLCL